MFEFTKEEAQLAQDLSILGGWKHADAATLKDRIRDYLLGIGITKCCYCLRSMHAVSRMIIDTEHVLPKGKYPEHTFEMINLHLSCKRCNMDIKKQDTSFFTAPENDSDRFESERYSIIHPNLDLAKDHLKIIMHQEDDDLLIVYHVVAGSLKGQATYDYFKLEDIAVNSFDRTQGEENVALSEHTPPAIAEKIETLQKQLKDS